MQILKASFGFLRATRSGTFKDESKKQSFVFFWTLSIFFLKLRVLHLKVRIVRWTIFRFQNRFQTVQVIFWQSIQNLPHYEFCMPNKLQKACARFEQKAVSSRFGHMVIFFKNDNLWYFCINRLLCNGFHNRT